MVWGACPVVGLLERERHWDRGRSRCWGSTCAQGCAVGMGTSVCWRGCVAAGWWCWGGGVLASLLSQAPHRPAPQISTSTSEPIWDEGFSFLVKRPHVESLELQVNPPPPFPPSLPPLSDPGLSSVCPSVPPAGEGRGGAEPGGAEPAPHPAAGGRDADARPLVPAQPLWPWQPGPAAGAAGGESPGGGGGGAGALETEPL